MNLPELGVHLDMPSHIYHKETPGISKTVLEVIVNKSPAHALECIESEESSPTPQMIFGSAFHHLLLETETFPDFYALARTDINRKTKAGREEYDAWLEGIGDRTIISQDDFRSMGDMCDAVKSHPTAQAILQDAVFEKALFWKDEETGEVCKCKPDIYNSPLSTIADIKTCASASKNDFARACANYGYHRQHAFYQDGHNLSGIPCETFCFIAVEKTPPYAVAVYVLNDIDVQLGRETIRKAINLYSACKNTDVWPGYDTQPQMISLPRWAYNTGEI